MKELTIAGGGLAGLALGIALRRRGVPVAIHEAGSYPRHRVCGEFISGVGPGTLSELGITEELSEAEELRSTRWFLGEGDEAIFAADLPEPARGISRYRLDVRLARRFEGEGGRLQTESRLLPEATEGLVWCAGRRARRKSVWLGLKMHVEEFAAQADLEMHVGKAGYVGIAAIEGGRVNVCGLFRRADFRAKGSALLRCYLEGSGLRPLAKRLREARPIESAVIGVSAFQLGRQRQDPGLCALGDAESIIPPFTGNGMSMAFEAAAAAVDPLVEWASGAREWPECRKCIRDALVHRFRRRLFTAQVLHPFLISPLGRCVMSASARHGLLPFRALLRLVR